jgi:predicted permease
VTVLAAVIVAATVVGVLVHRRRPAAAERVAHRLMDSILWLILPIVAFFNMAALELTVQIGAGIAFAYAGLLATMLAAWLMGARLLGLSRPATGALIVSAGLANTGYLGLPFNAATLGFSALPEAVAYDVLVSGVALVTVGFSVGAAFGTEPTRGGGRLKAFFARNPALWATVAGLLAPEVLAPGAAVDASRILVVATVPIGFFAVGVALAGESTGAEGRWPPLARLDRPVAAAAGLKLVVTPAVVVWLSAVVIRVPDAYLLQAAMPTGVNTLVIAHAYGLDRRIAAGAIACTTTVVVAVGVVAELL